MGSFLRTYEKYDLHTRIKFVLIELKVEDLSQQFESFSIDVKSP